MKKLLYCALLLLPALAQAQTEHFVLKGRVSAPAGVTKAYLRYGLPNGFVLDSAAVKTAVLSSGEPWSSRSRPPWY